MPLDSGARAHVLQCDTPQAPIFALAASTRDPISSLAMRRLMAFLVALVCGLPFGVEWPALAQSVLPDAPGKDVTVRVCGQCHSADIVASVRLTREGWQETVADMVQQGATATDAEQTAILDYVSSHFKGEARRPLNVNSATAVELESVAGLLRKEAAALIAFLEKSGPCKKLEDLKKAAGVDYKKIDARKDRLVCM
jgi:competence ComEA-like helix-hairpin-helix protein